MQPLQFLLLCAIAVIAAPAVLAASCDSYDTCTACGQQSDCVWGGGSQGFMCMYTDDFDKVVNLNMTTAHPFCTYGSPDSCSSHCNIDADFIDSTAETGVEWYFTHAIGKVASSFNPSSGAFDDANVASQSLYSAPALGMGSFNEVVINGLVKNHMAQIQLVQVDSYAGDKYPTKTPYDGKNPVKSMDIAKSNWYMHAPDDMYDVEDGLLNVTLTSDGTDTLSLSSYCASTVKVSEIKGDFKCDVDVTTTPTHNQGLAFKFQMFAVAGTGASITRNLHLHVEDNLKNVLFSIPTQASNGSHHTPLVVSPKTRVQYNSESPQASIFEVWVKAPVGFGPFHFKFGQTTL